MKLVDVHWNSQKLLQKLQQWVENIKFYFKLDQELTMYWKIIDKVYLQMVDWAWMGWTNFSSNR